LSRSSASPTSRAVCASSNRLAGQLAASTSAICADLVDPGRVNIFERWESQAALETFRSSGPDTEQRRAMLTVSVQEYPIADVRAVFGEGAE
jgi:quinol monooxygenase YgiN